MNGHTPGAWRYIASSKGVRSVISVGDGNVDDFHGYGTNVLADVYAEGVIDPEANARLIAAAPEMYTALENSVVALRATAVFIRGQDLDAGELDEIINTLCALLGKIDGARGSFAQGY